MKKRIFLFLFIMLFISGCGKYKVSDAVKDFENKVDNSKSYKLTGTMEISSSEEVFTYSLEAYHLKDDFFKVILVNQTNNHEQIILKNNDGLYVVTPSLNKSFKFDSVWPENSSQAYLLGNLVKDMKNDSKIEMEEKDKGYIIKTTVNYPNNEEMKYQKIYFNEDMKIEKVEVFNESDIVKIKVNFNKVDLKAKLSDEDFVLDDLIDEEKTKPECKDDSCDKETSSTLDSIIYPLYIPANTYLNNKETVESLKSERIILTFSGEKNFVIVEEAAKASNVFEVIPIYGEPLMLNETIGALSSNSLSFQANNVDYYIVSSDLSTKEMISVAASLGNTTSVAGVK
ncbi:MAG: hypothetical protein RSG95_02655 [Bacilli bacterium]